MIKIDFHGSTHGHFLEYVSNVYIMKTLPGNKNIFNSNGAAHASDNEYKYNRLIECGHYSNTNFFSDDIIIRITIDTNNDEFFFISLINLMHRAGDVGMEKQLLNIPDTIRNIRYLHRNDWYSKFNERNKYVNQYYEFIKIPNLVFEFPFNAFYSFPLFCKKLNELAVFLNNQWFPDESLYNLWKTFMKKNQGWQAYIKCNSIIENIMGNISYKFECNEIEEGWINYNLSKICRIYDGELFNEDLYPDNCQDIYKILERHIKSFN